MQKYIGTKLIEAEKAIRYFMPGGQIVTVADSEEITEETHQALGECAAAERGYKVRYPDGYMSWSPKNVFEEAYMPCTAMNFGLAIEAAKMGRRIARRGWNGKNQYVELAQRISYVNANGDAVNAEHDAMGNKALIDDLKAIKYSTIVLTTVPVLCIYPFLQKYFVKGVMVGAVKG